LVAAERSEAALRGVHVQQEAAERSAVEVPAGVPA
jgi:hypothetical protein